MHYFFSFGTHLQVIQLCTLAVGMRGVDGTAALRDRCEVQVRRQAPKLMRIMIIHRKWAYTRLGHTRVPQTRGLNMCTCKHVIVDRHPAPALEKAAVVHQAFQVV